MKTVPKNYKCKKCGVEKYQSYDTCERCGSVFSFETIKLETKTQVIKDYIDKYFKMLKSQNREVDENTLCELIQQWAFDHRMEKNLNRFN